MDLNLRIRGGPVPLLWDGGVGTALIEQGLDLSVESPESWLLRHPDRVRAVHQEFAAAGADVIQTNTFGLLRLRLQADGAKRDARSLVEAAVALARQGAVAGVGDRPLPEVIGCLGPGASSSSVQVAQVEAYAAYLAGLFEELGVGAIHLETFYDPNELRAAIRGVRARAPRLTLLASMTVTRGNSGLETPLGTPLAYMVKVMEEEQPDIVGLNCSQNARRMRPAVEVLRRAMGGGVKILAQPQVGQQGAECKGSTRPESSEQFVQGLLGLLDAGADAVGGCCGCRGTHLAAARQAIGPAAQPMIAFPEGG